MLAFRNDRFSPSGTDGSNPLSSSEELVANLTFGGARPSSTIPIVFAVAGDPVEVDHHHHSERVVRAAAQPHARGPETQRLAGLARGGAGGGVRAQGPAEADPLGRDDLLARERAGRQRQV